MCIIFVVYRMHREYPLIVAANRDEYWQRPARPAHFWPDAPHILAGRDLMAGGTWLGMTRQGRFAAVTNFREFPPVRGARSRGVLVSRFLLDHEAPEASLKKMAQESGAYSGYNLLAGHRDALYYHTNRKSGRFEPLALSPGFYGLSNHLLNTPWFKVKKGKELLKAACSHQTVSPGELFELLADREEAPDDQLPETGIGPEREKRLSPIFIRDHVYGTRCSTVLLISREYAWFSERTYEPDYSRFTERTFVFPLEGVVN